MSHQRIDRHIDVPNADQMNTPSAPPLAEGELQECLEELEEMLKQRRRNFDERVQFLNAHVFQSVVCPYASDMCDKTAGVLARTC